MGELSSARLRDELQDLFSEERVTDSVRRLAELGIDRAVHARLAADDDAGRLIEQLDGLRMRYAPSTPAWRLRLAVLARKMSSTEVLDWSDRLKLRRRDAERIADAVTVAPRLRELVAGIKDAAELRAVVEPHDPDGALLALAQAKGKGAKQLTRYFEELRGVRLEISGGDLVALGLGESPRVGAVLEELLRRKLNGQLDGRSAELEAARELLEALSGHRHASPASPDRAREPDAARARARVGGVETWRPDRSRPGAPDPEPARASRPARDDDVHPHGAPRQPPVRLGASRSGQSRLLPPAEGGMAIVAAAGPAMNFLLALLCLAVIRHVDLGAAGARGGGERLHRQRRARRLQPHPGPAARRLPDHRRAHGPRDLRAGSSSTSSGC